MRMWMIDPKFLCQKHLCGEHLEHHMFIGIIKRKKRVDGYIKNNCFQPRALFERHNLLVSEMERRGYNHKSPILEIDCDIFYLPYEYQNWEIDCNKSLNDLLKRCSECKSRYEGLNNER